MHGNRIVPTVEEVLLWPLLSTSASVNRDSLDDVRPSRIQSSTRHVNFNSSMGVRLTGDAPSPPFVAVELITAANTCKHIPSPVVIGWDHVQAQREQSTYVADPARFRPQGSPCTC